MYHDRENLKAANILILSPNNAFSDYISHILPELGEEHIQEMSFDLFAYKELKEVANDCEDRYDYLEKKMKFKTVNGKSALKEKQSEGFVGMMEGFLASLEDELMDFRTIEYKGFQRPKKRSFICFILNFKSSAACENGCGNGILIDEYETLRGKNISEEDI